MEEAKHLAQIASGAQVFDDIHGKKFLAALAARKKRALLHLKSQWFPQVMASTRRH